MAKNRYDTTKLGAFDRTIENCQVVSIPAGATPKSIVVELPYEDEPRVNAWWRGFPSLAVNDFVEVRFRRGGRPQYVVTGTSAGTGTSGGGGWPFDNELTVDQTNVDADYATLLAAHTAAAADDVLTLGPASYAEAAVTINKNVSVQGRNRRRTIINNPLTIDHSGADISDLYVYVSGSGAFALKLKSTSGGRNVAAEHWSVADARAVVIEGSMTLRDLFARSNGSATSYAVEVAATGAVLLEFDCYLTAGGTGPYDLYIQAGGSAVLNGCILAGGTIGGDTAAVTGWYRTNDGNIHVLPNWNHNTGVWLEDESAALRIKKLDFAAALSAAAASGDSITFDTGTYDLGTASINIAKSLTVEGNGPEATIITLDIDDTAAFNVTADDTTLVFRNLTLLVAGDTGAVGALFTDNSGVKIILDNVIARKTSGASTTGYGAWVEAGTLELRNGSKLLAEAGADQHGIMNLSTAADVVIGPGCEVGGGTKDIYGAVAGSTLTLNGAILTNNLLNWAGTLEGRWLNASGVLYAPESNDTFSPQTFRPGYIIVPSVSSNNLTVALKTLDNNDASAASPIVVRIGDAVQAITASLSTTKNAGTNWCNAGSSELAAQEIDYFVYLIQETGASAGTKIGFSRVPYARQMGDFTNTTTSEKYIAGSWTNFNSTDKVEVIGRFNATLSAAASYNWSIPATSIIINRPIYETRWLSYTPTMTASTGTITTPGTRSGAYQVSYNRLFFNQSGTITTNGTGAGGLNMTLPLTVTLDNSICAGREDAVTGNELQARAAGTYMQYFTYANAYPGGDGRTIKGGGIALRLI